MSYSPNNNSSNFIHKNSILSPTINSDIEKLPEPTASLSDEQQILLNLAIGEKDCSDSKTGKAINYIALALISAILFLVLNFPAVDNALAMLIPNCGARLLFKTLIFFLIIYLIDRAICEWRTDQVFCE